MYIYNAYCSNCRFWKLTLRLKKNSRYIYLTIFFLLIVIVKIKESWDILRFQQFQFLKNMNYVFRLQVKCIASFIAFQIHVTVSALRNTRSLPWPKDYKKKVDEDILDWLQAMFGFQVRLLPNRLSYTSQIFMFHQQAMLHS